MHGIRPLAQAANEEFNGVTPDEWDSYCEQLNIPVKKNSTLEWKERQVRTAIEQGAKAGIVETHVKAPRQIAGKQLNLRSTGRWEGRRHLVTIQESEADVRSSWKCLSWDASQILVHTGMEVSIPYPHYEILKNAVREIYTVKNVPRADGTIERQESTRFVSSLPYQDHGDDPATKDLPISFIARAQDEARAKNYYQGTPRNILVRMLTELVDGNITREVLKDMTDEELREQVMNKLGLYEEVMETDYALDNAA